MNAIMVCVDLADKLAITLPYNRPHFNRVVVVTATRDQATQQICKDHDADTFITEAFWDGGAVFNKWKALEQGLDWMGRNGWLCIMDCDVMWPSWVTDGKTADSCSDGTIWRHLRHGYLFTPMRRMMLDVSKPVPPEEQWKQFPLHPQQHEFAGYTQIFHATDPVLGEAPWHETNWRHCGGADSFFQAKWPQDRKVRPPFEVLHLGPAGEDWCGRATPYMGTNQRPQDAAAKIETVRRFIRGRTRGVGRFDGEKML